MISIRRTRFTGILLGATALTLPLGMNAFAQEAQNAQQGQQAKTEQSRDLNACDRLQRIVDEAEQERILADFEKAPELARSDDEKACAEMIAKVEETGGISEEAVAEKRGTQFLTDTDSFTAHDRVEQTLRIEQEAVVEGEVLVRQAIPEIGIEQPGPDVDVTEGDVDVMLDEQPASILIRQAPANVRVEIPEPTITIEQPAPEIVLQMPPAGVSLERQPPQVTVNMPDPQVSVAQAEPQVTADVEAHFVNPDEIAELDDKDRPQIRTRTERLDAGNNPVNEDKTAEVTIRKGEADINIAETEQKADVQVKRAEPKVTFEQAEPNVEIAFARNANVDVKRTGEPKVTVRRGDEEQSHAGAGDQGSQQDRQALQDQSQEQQQSELTGNQAQNPQMVAGDRNGQQIEDHLQAAEKAFDQDETDTARAEIKAAKERLASFNQADGLDDHARTEIRGLISQLDQADNALSNEDLERAEAALDDAVANFDQNQDEIFAAAGTRNETRTGQQNAEGESEAKTADRNQTESETKVSTASDQQATAERNDDQRLSAADTNRLLSEQSGTDLDAQQTEIRAGDLVGEDVRTMRDEDVGKVSEIVSSGDSIFVVIEHGGFLGIGEHQIAVPLDRIAVRGDEVILLGMTEEQLEQLADYDFNADETFSANDQIKVERIE